MSDNTTKQPVQRVTVTGRITKDPKIGVTKSGDKYVSLNIAADTDSGETLWLDGVAYGLLAANLETRMKKGVKARFKGGVRVREYQKKDGSIGTSNNFTIDSVQVVEGGKVVTVDEFTSTPF